MKGHYSLDESSKSQVKDIVIAIIEYINNHEDAGYNSISLNPLDVSPSQIINILKELGYVNCETNFNGWEGDASWHFYKSDAKPIILFYCGYEFNMSISLEKINEEDE